jgi:SAM-dependent methyltransferase
VSARGEFAGRLASLLVPGAREWVGENYLRLPLEASAANQAQTSAVFTAKWSKHDEAADRDKLYAMQRRWYLELYGFASERELARFLGGRSVIFDAGCGLGYKAAWFAELAPRSLVVGMDLSQAAERAAGHYRELPNLFFMHGDLGATPFVGGSFDYVSCDQTIMHTQEPDAAFRELARVTASGGELACYFYAKKALPRELLDEHFRRRCLEMGEEQLWEMAEQLTELGRRLSELEISFDAPEVTALGIKAGRYDLQRFVYWNFLKCFWNPELGRATSVVTNFDWYSPSNAKRYAEEEVRELVRATGLSVVTFHHEEACYSGRFAKP